MAIEVAQPVFNAINTATQSQMASMNTVMSVIGIVIGGFWIVYIQMKFPLSLVYGMLLVIQYLLQCVPFYSMFLVVSHFLVLRLVLSLL